MSLVRWLFRSQNSLYEEDRATIAANNEVENDDVDGEMKGKG